MEQQGHLARPGSQTERGRPRPLSTPPSPLPHARGLWRQSGIKSYEETGEGASGKKAVISGDAARLSGGPASPALVRPPCRPRAAAVGTDPLLTLCGPSAAGCVHSADFQPQSRHLLPWQMLAWASNFITSIKRARLPQFLRTTPGDKGHSLWVPCSAALCPQCFLEGRPSSEPSRTGPEAPAPACPLDTPQHRPPSFSGSLELVCPSMLPSSNLSHLSRELIFQEILSLQTNSGIKRDNA